MSASPAQRDAAGVPNLDRRGPRVIAVSFAAGLAWALFTFLALPPVSLWWIGIAAPLPVAWVAWTTSRPLLASLGVALGTLPFWGYHHAWIADVSLAGVVPLMGYLAAWMAAAVWVLARLRRVAGGLGPAVVIPTAWVGLEYCRGEILFEGYPWFMSGHAMIESPTVSRAATLGGVYFVSWLVVSVAGMAIASRLGSRTHRRVGLGVSAGVVVLLLASVVIPRASAPSDVQQVRVGALQTDVPQDNKNFPSREELVEDFRELVSLADQAADDGAQLLVTPETVLPTGLLDAEARAVIDEPFGDAMLAEQRRIGVPMLVGCTTLGGVRIENDRFAWDDTYNSVFLLVNGETVGPRYDKLRPTPFGETLPYVQSFPWLRDIVLQIGLGASGMDFGLTPGSKPTSFEVPIGRRSIVVTTPICFESSMAPTVRQLVNAARADGRPTEMLCVVTNDGWFGPFDPGRVMHLLQARWRCIEHGLPMIRSANTGVSAIIDRSGRVVASLEPGEAGVLVGAISPGATQTPYQAVGDRWGTLCMVLTLVGLAASVRAGRTAVRKRTLAVGTDSTGDSQ